MVSEIPSQPPLPRPAASPQLRGGRAVGGAPRANAGGHQLLRALRGWQGRRRQGGGGLKTSENQQKNCGKLGIYGDSS